MPDSDTALRAVRYKARIPARRPGDRGGHAAPRGLLQG